jgi:hypothetical protein
MVRHALPTVKPNPPPPGPPELLFLRGNGKLGELFLHWDLPAGPTCPGKTRACFGRQRVGPAAKPEGSRRCYAFRMYAYRPGLLARHRRNLALLADLDAWALRAAEELAFRRLPFVRWHVSGDLMSVPYAWAVFWVMKETPRVRHWITTRSWRRSEFLPALRAMAALPNVSVWFSCDHSAPPPASVPGGVRLSWMALRAEEESAHARHVARCELVFLDFPLRRRRGPGVFAGVPVCPQEHDKGVTCSACQRCLPEGV